MSNQYAGRYYDAFLDVNTKLLKDTQYIVTTDSAGLNMATLYTDRTKTVTANAIRTTNGFGMAEFYAAPGTYYVNIAGDIREVRVYEDIADTADVAQVAADIATHSADTTNVHGITDTSALETQSGAQTKANTARDAAIAASQPLDSDLTAFAALTPANDDIPQRKGGVWVSRTPAQLKADLGITAITGQYLGSASTFGTLPVTDTSGAAASNGDWAFLTTDVVGTGTSVAPQYPRGAYIYNGSTFSLALSVGADFIVGTTTGTVAAGDDSRIVGARQRYLDQGAAKTSSYSMSVWDRASFDLTNGSITQALPSSPVIGDEVQIYVSALSGTNTLSITGTGGPFSISAAGHGVTLLWTGTAWAETQDRKTTGSLDARYRQKSDTTNFYLVDYGAQVGVTTNAAALANITAFQNAYAAAKVAGGRIIMPPGVIFVGASTGTNHAVVALDYNAAGTVSFVGAGKTATTIRLGGVVSCFLAAYISTATYQDVECSDFTLDDNFVTSYSYTELGPIFTTGADSNFYRFSFRRIRGINAGNLKTFGIERRWICFSPYNEGSTTRKYITDIVVDDCQFYGGNYAVQLQGFSSNPPAMRSFVDGTRTNPTTDVYFDRIDIRRVFWDSGAPIAFGANGYSATGIICSNYSIGGSLVLDHCVLRNSSDDVIEINGMMDVTVRSCIIENGRYEKLYLANLGGNFTPERQHILIENCTFLESAGNSTNDILVGSHAPFGSITVRDCVSYNSLTPNVFFSVIGNIRSVTVENNTVVSSALSSLVATFNGANYGATGISIFPRGGRGSITVRNNKIVARQQFIGTGYSGTAFTYLAIAAGGTDHTIVLDNNTYESFITGASSTVNSRFIAAGSAPSGYVFDFSTTWLLNSIAIPESGTAADIAYTSGIITPSGTATLTAEQRQIFVDQYDATFFYTPLGPYTDGGAYTKGKPGTTTLSGWKLGAVGKRVSPNTYLDAYITDDGSASTLCLDAVINGTRTQLTAPVSITRLVVGTYYWVRISIVDNVVTGTLHTSGPPSITTAGTSTITATLTSTNLSTFGDTVQGYFGFSWIPQDVTSAIDEWGMLPLGVNSLDIRNNRVGRMGANTATALGIAITPTVGRIRRLVLSDNDLTQLKNATTPTDLTLPTAISTAAAVTTRRGNMLSNGTVDSVVGKFKAVGFTITTSYTLSESDSGQVILYDSTSAGTITMPGTLPQWFTITVIQVNTGAVSFAASGSGSIVSAPAYTKTNGANSEVSLIVQTNTTGSNAVGNLAGNGAT